MNFYKTTISSTPLKSSSSENCVTPPSAQRYKLSRKRDDRINKGVGHRIKKPKVTKAKEKKSNKAKIIIGRLREVKIPPRLATNRSPRLPGEKIKRHVLSSPGVSFLDTADTPHSPEKKRFFTSRSAEPATVRLTNNIKLSAKNGEILMKHRVGGFEKKNIGKYVEEALNQAIEDHSCSPTDVMSKEDLIKFSTMSTIVDCPKPTRFLINSPKGLRSPSSKSVQIKSDRIMRSSPCKQLLTNTGNSCKHSHINGDSTPKQSIKLNNKAHSIKCNMEQLVLSPFESPVNASSPSNYSKSVCSRRLIDDHETSIENDRLEDEVGKSDDSRVELSDFDETFKDINESGEVVDEILTSLILKNGSPKRIWNSPRRSPRKHLLKMKSDSSSVKSSPSKVLSETNVNITSLAKHEKNVKYFPIFSSEHRLKSKENVDDKENKGSQNTRKFHTKSDINQLSIDAGQKSFGAIQCQTCGLVYEIGEPDDEEQHTRFHNGFTTALKFPGWKNERQVTYLNLKGGKIIQVIPTDYSYYWNKVKDILEYVDQDLGFAENGIQCKGLRTAYLYIKDRNVVGCLISEDISKAYRVIQRSSTNDPKSTKLVCCSNNPEKVCIGISRIWVRALERRKDVATDLVNAMRANAITGHYLTTNDFAFSDPTELGMIFAEKYCQRSDFMVYRRE